MSKVLCTGQSVDLYEIKIAISIQDDAWEDFDDDGFMEAACMVEVCLALDMLFLWSSICCILSAIIHSNMLSMPREKLVLRDHRDPEEPLLRPKLCKLLIPQQL